MGSANTISSNLPFIGKCEGPILFLKPGSGHALENFVWRPWLLFKKMLWAFFVFCIIVSFS